MIDDGRLAVLGEEAGAAEHAVAGELGLQVARLPGPMHHVIAGDMGEVEPLMVIDIMQMIFAIPIEGAVRIAGGGIAGTGVYQMIGQPVGRRIGRHVGRFAGDDGHAFRRGNEGRAVGVQNQASAFDLGAVYQRVDGKFSHRIGSPALCEVPPSVWLACRFLAGFQFPDFILAQGHVINPGILDGAMECLAGGRAPMPDAEHDHRVRRS